jgi:Uma2 family endonuclease
MSAQSIPRLTPEQYLAIEREADIRHEYFDGQMFAMSGGTYAHAALIANLIRRLSQALDGVSCRVLASELRVRTSPDGLYTYPDIVGICGAPRFADDQKDTLLNPVLLIEVLSKSTEAHDRGFKFMSCRRIESLREYALVSQSEPRLEVFERRDGEWFLRESAGLDAVCRFASVGCEISLADIYRDIG